MITQKQRDRLEALTSKYRFSFYIQGSLTSTYNLIRIASFIQLKNPSEYEAFQVDDDRYLIFYNPQKINYK